MSQASKGSSLSLEGERVADAIIDLVIANGYEATTVEAVINRAGVRRVDFERSFAGKEDCVIKVIDDRVGLLATDVFSAYQQHASWRDGLRAAAYAAAGWVGENARYALFSSLMMNDATDLARARRDMSLQLFTTIIDDGRRELPDPDAISPSTSLTVIGSIYQLLLRELSRPCNNKTPADFVPELMYIAVRPYLGPEAALEELTIPPPSPQDQV